MIKIRFGDAVAGQPFSWGGAQFVKTLPYQKGNSVELGTLYGVWGCFFDDVIVEIESVETEQNGLLPVEAQGVNNA